VCRFSIRGVGDGVVGSVRLVSSTRARCCCTVAVSRACRVLREEVVMVIFGGEVEVEEGVMEADERVCAFVLWVKARERRASAFLGAERRA